MHPRSLYCNFFQFNHPPSLVQIYDALSFNCFENPYPQVFGGTNGDTEITAFDIDPYEYYMYFGGTSTDTSIVLSTNLPNAFIGRQSYDGFLIGQWAISDQFNTVISIIQAPGPDRDINEIFVLLDGSPTTLVTMGYSGIISSYSFSVPSTSSYPVQAYSYFDSKYQYHYLTVVLQSPVKVWQIVTFKCWNNLCVVNQQIEGYSSGTYANTVTQYQTGEQMVGGYSIDPLTGISYASVVSLGGGWAYGLDLGIDPVETIAVSQILFQSSTTIYATVEQYSNIEDPLRILTLNLNSSTRAVKSHNLQILSTSNQVYRCKSFAISNSYIYIIIQVPTASDSSRMVLANGTSTGQLNFQIMSSLYGIYANITHGVFINGWNQAAGGKYFAYYSGSFLNIASQNIDMSYLKYQGFIMQPYDSQSCLTFTYTPVVMNFASDTSHNVTEFTFISGNLTATTGSSSVSFDWFNPLLLTNVSSWCYNPHQTNITNITLPYDFDCQSYNKMAFNYPILNNTCDDYEELTYTIENVDGSALTVPLSNMLSISTTSGGIATFLCQNHYIYETGNYSFAINVFNQYSFNSTYYYTFWVDDPCNGVIINGTNTANYTFYVNQTFQVDYIPYFPLSNAFMPSECYFWGTKGVTVTPATSAFYVGYANGGGVSNSIYKMYINITTSDNNDVGVYNVSYTQYLNLYNYTTPSWFIVTIYDQCIMTKVMTVPINTFYYDVSFNNISIADNKLWGQTQQYCQNKYPLQYEFSVNTSDGIIYMTSPKVINVVTNSATDVGVYNATITGIVQQYSITNISGGGVFFTQTSLTFFIVISDNCTTQYTVTTTTVYNTIYYIGNPLQLMNFSSWILYYPFCGPLIYTATYNDSSALDSYLYFDGSDQYLSVQTNDTTQAGTYTIKIKGETPEGRTQYKTFNISLIDQCPFAAISTQYMMFNSFYVQDSPQLISLPVFSSNMSSIVCGNWSYLFTNIDATPINNLLFSVTSSSFQVSTMDPDNIGIYSFKIVAYQGNYSLHNISNDFSIQLLDRCLLNSITTYSISNQSYNISQDPYIFFYTPFKSSISPCGSYNYNFTFYNGSSLDSSIFTFNPLTSSIQIYANDSYAIGIYQVMLTGTLPRNYGSSNISFYIFIGCQFQSIISPTQLSSIYYYVDQDALEVDFDPFIQYPSCGDTFTYKAFTDTGTLPYFITFSPTNQSFSIYTKSFQDQGTYTIYVKGTLDNVYSSSATPLSFTLTVIEQRYNIPTNNTPPYFTSTIQNNVQVIVNQTSTLTLPGTYDNEGNKITMSYTATGIGLSFITYNSGSFAFQPVNLDQVGSYCLVIQLADNSIIPMSNYYTVIVTVASSLESFNISANATNGTSNSTSINGSSSDSNGSYVPQNKTLSNLKGSVMPVVSENVSAVILSINEKGSLIIYFYQTMMLPTDKDYPFSDVNFTDFDISNINITLVQNQQQLAEDGNSSSDNNTLLGWQVQSVTSTEIIIDLNFSNPLFVSSQDIKDQISVSLVSNYYFIEASTGYCFPEGYLMQKVIPSQLQDSNSKSTQALELIAGAAKYSTTTVIVLNMLLTLLLQNAHKSHNPNYRKVSLKRLWNMIITFQLIVHMPLLNILTPANVSYYLSMFVSIISFQIIPVDEIMTKMFHYQKEISTAASSSLASSGYGSSDIISNLGMFLFLFVGLVLVSGLLIFIKVLGSKFQIVKRLYNSVKNMIFFNTILRTLINGYLNNSLSTLLALQHLAFNTTKSVINSLVTLLVLLIIAGFPPFALIYPIKNYSKLSTPSFQAQFITMYTGINLNPVTSPGPIAVTALSLQLIRRLSFALIVVFASDYPIVQIFVLFLPSLGLLFFNAGVQPMESTVNNFIESFNEYCLLTCFCFAFLFSDFVPDVQMRYTLGWVFLAIAALTILANVILVIGTMYSQIKAMLKKLWSKRKAKLHQMKMKQYELDELKRTQMKQDLEQSNNNLILQDVDLDGTSKHKAFDSEALINKVSTQDSLLNKNKKRIKRIKKKKLDRTTDKDFTATSQNIFLPPEVTDLSNYKENPFFNKSSLFGTVKPAPKNLSTLYQ